MKHNAPNSWWLTPTSAAAFLTAALAGAPTLVPILVLQLFAGLRLAEALRLTWDSISLADDLIYVQSTKSGRFRVVTISPNLKAWLLRCQKRTGLIFEGSSSAFQGRTLELYRLVGLARRRGDLRSTFALYHYYYHLDPGLTFSELGQNGPVLHWPLFRLISKADVENFWLILPPPTPDED